ncbi:hypothetical protein [Bacillus thuringiensis]|uniref:hypothetical protein n=1 Tax=Bacillus thuringiensis TaxID=1428 RepID=UPI0021D68976|nr:hypothetical protein [Bacillus thuringiensis]MCU7667316.1 hypothetical protein [Bacillus thuringiensis]
MLLFSINDKEKLDEFLKNKREEEQREQTILNEKTTELTVELKNVVFSFMGSNRK